MKDPDRKVWEEVFACLRRTRPAMCRQWFHEIVELGIANGSLGLRVMSAVHRDYLRKECLAEFNDAVRTVTGHLVAVKFYGPDDDATIDGFGAPPAVAPRRARGHARPGSSVDPDTVIADESLPIGNEPRKATNPVVPLHRPRAPIASTDGGPGGGVRSAVSAGLPLPRPGGTGLGPRGEAPPVGSFGPTGGPIDSAGRLHDDRRHWTPTDRTGDDELADGDSHGTGRGNGHHEPGAGPLPPGVTPGGLGQDHQPHPYPGAPDSVVEWNPVRPWAAGLPRAGQHADRDMRDPTPATGQDEAGHSNSDATPPRLPTVSASDPGPPSAWPDRGGTGNRAAPRQHRSTESPDDAVSGMVLNPDYHFNNFIVGPNNRYAHAAASAVADQPGRAYNPLFIHGGVGLGKTHLLQAMCLHIREHSPGLRMLYVACESFVSQFMNAVREGLMHEFRHRFRDIDLLVMDDIHFLAKRDRSQEEFFHTFNALHQAQKQLVLSSDAQPSDIPEIEERLVSRFTWGLVTAMEPPTYETRIEIIISKARLRGLILPGDVASYMAERLTGNIREIEGAITRIQIRVETELPPAAQSVPVTMELVKAALGDAPARIERGPTMDAILAVVCSHYNVKRADLLGKSRTQSISKPRQVAMHLARSATDLSLEEIGLRFGRRDHTTVMHAIRTVEGLMSKEESFAATVRGLAAELARMGQRR